MNNNYEYVQRLKQDIEEQEKIKKELKRDLDYLLITEEEKENIITKVFSNEIETYKPTTILPFQKYIKKKLENEINKVYFAPSTIIPIQEQKIIYLYLNQRQNRYLTEDEIRISLHTDSKNVYLALKKLRPASTQIKEELNKLFPNYKRQLKKRQVFFNQTPVISEQDLKYLGYYIGEINDICLSVDEIAKKEGKTESEIQKSLKAIFKLLKEKENIELVKTRYPNCEKMLQIKATNFGINLYVDKNEKEGKKEYSSAPKQKQLKKKKEKEQKSQKEKSLLTKKQETILKELAKSPNISRKELANLVGYKNENSIWATISTLKKKCEKSQQLKEKVLEIYPNFLNPKSEPKISLLTKKQEILLKMLAKNPNISRKELAKLVGYKNENSIWATISTLKKKCEKSQQLKEKVLEIYPNFLNPKSEPKNSLLTTKEEILLKTLAKNPNISRKELAKLVGYKNENSIWATIDTLKKKCEKNQQSKEKVLEIYPNFLNPKSEQKNSLLTKKQEILLKALAENPNISRKELAKLTGYKNENSIWATISTLKKKCEKNQQLKEKVLEVCPNFLNSKSKSKKSLLTTKQEILLKALAKNPNISRKELANLVGYKNENSIWTTINTLKKKCEKNQQLKEKVLELNPDFLTSISEQKNALLTTKQEILLKALAKNPNISRKELAKLVGYKNENSIWTTISILKKKCKENQQLKEKVLELNPDFLTSKPKQKKEIQQQEPPTLTTQELQILQNIYLITPPRTSYITYGQLSSKFYYSESYIQYVKNKALEKIESNPEIRKKLQEKWPSFEQDKVIREHYKKRRSIKIPSQDLEKIKSFIRQYDIPENNVQEEKRNNILIGIHNLENSIFSPYVSKCTEEQKAMLALRLGFINAPSTTEIVAELFGVEQQEVITLTKKCLQSAKPPLTAKTYQKKKEN